MYVITFRIPLARILPFTARLFFALDWYRISAGVATVLYRFRPSALGISALLVYGHVKSFRHFA